METTTKTANKIEIVNAHDADCQVCGAMIFGVAYRAERFSVYDGGVSVIACSRTCAIGWQVRGADRDTWRGYREAVYFA